MGREFEMLYRWFSLGSVVEIEVLEIDGNVYFYHFSVHLNHASMVIWKDVAISGYRFYCPE